MSSLAWIRGQQWRLVLPDLVYVLNDDERLTHRLSIVDENQDLLMNGVHLQKQGVLVLPQVLLLVLIVNPLLNQCNLHPHPIHARPEI